MIDRTLLGAIERALEKKEPLPSIIQSLQYSGYSEQDVREAIALIQRKKEQSAPIPIKEIPKKEIQQSTEVQSSFTPISYQKKRFKLKQFITPSVLIASIILLLLTYLRVSSALKSCSQIAIGKKHILFLYLTCNQVNIFAIEIWIAIITISIILIIILIKNLKS